MKAKRVLATVLAIVFALTIAVTAIPASAADYKVAVPAGATDILNGADGTIVSKSASRSGLISEVNSPAIDSTALCDVLTDGELINANAGSKPLTYLNVPVSGSTTCVDYDLAGGDFTFNGVESTAYYYYIEYSNLLGDASSFALYFTQNKETEIPFYQIDAAFDILVSTDGGNTYTKAWSSAPYQVEYESKANGNVLRAAGWDYALGGNMVSATVADENGVSINYKYVIANFDKTYTGVTNVVYACAAMRRNGNQGKAFYYCARMCEFDVYAEKLSDTQVTPASIEPVETTQAEETTLYPVVTGGADEETTEYKAYTKAPTTTKAPETTSAPETTTAPATEEKSGCGSSVSFAGLATLLACGLVIVRKKH